MKIEWTDAALDAADAAFSNFNLVDTEDDIEYVRDAFRTILNAALAEMRIDKKAMKVAWTDSALRAGLATTSINSDPVKVFRDQMDAAVAEMLRSGDAKAADVVPGPMVSWTANARTTDGVPARFPAIILKAKEYS